MEKLRKFAIWSAVILAGLIWLFSEPQNKASAVASNAPEAVAAPPSGLSAISVGGLRWSTSVGDSIMEASFSLTNRNRYAVKDLIVTCVHSANSGTVIDSNTRPVYERIPPSQTILVHDLNMGFIHNQAQYTRCVVTGFNPA